MIHEDCSQRRGGGQGRVQLIGAFKWAKGKKENFLRRSPKGKTDSNWLKLQ